MLLNHCWGKCKKSYHDCLKKQGTSFKKTEKELQKLEARAVLITHIGELFQADRTWRREDF